MRLSVDDPAGSGRTASLFVVAGNAAATGFLAYRASLTEGVAHFVYAGVALVACALAVLDLYRWLRWRDAT